MAKMLIYFCFYSAILMERNEFEVFLRNSYHTFTLFFWQL